MQLGEKYREEGKTKEMTDLIERVKGLLKYMSKAKAAKLVRGLVDMFLDMRKEGESGDKEVQLCKVKIRSSLDNANNLVFWCRFLNKSEPWPTVYIMQQ